MGRKKERKKESGGVIKSPIHPSQQAKLISDLVYNNI